MKSASLILLGSALIFCQLLCMYRDPQSITSEPITAASGMLDDIRFVYFYSTLGLYPLTLPRELNREELSSNAAQALIAQEGANLMTEYGITSRTGDRGRIWFYLPKVWWTGAMDHPSTREASGLLFAVSVCALFAACVLVRRAVFGGLLSVFLVSNPFQLGEVFKRDNVFSLVITAAVLVLALSVPFLDGAPRKWRTVGIAAALAGMLLATVLQIRTEPTALALSIVLMFWYLPSMPVRQRTLGIIVFATTFWGAGVFWRSYWHGKIRQAERVVLEHAGNVYTGPRMDTHAIWHPLWCGLGDFDTKHGHEWSDRTASLAAIPVLRERFGLSVSDLGPGQWNFREYYDPRRQYFVSPLFLPHYDEVIRDLFLADISSAPLWYTGILLQRAKKILSETTPLSLRAGNASVTVPWNGWCALVVCCALLALRRRFELGVILFLLPTGFTALFVYSGRGTQQYFIAHLAAAAALLTVVAQLLTKQRSQSQDD